MTFVPKSGKHAIAEVVFGLVFTKAFEPQQIEQLVRSHHLWRDHLPRVSRGGGFQVTFGPGFPPPEIQLPFQTGVSFERVNPDGTLNWRLRIDQQSIYVNCLDYSRWSQIWPIARRYMAQVIEASQIQADVVQSVLQYIDVFEWSGDTEKFSIKELLRVGNDYIPASMADRGHLFHLHQGWFNSTARGRRLVRAHVDGVEEASLELSEQSIRKSSPIVKIDTYIQDDLTQPLSNKDAFDSGWIDQSFSDMHDENKNILYAFLTDEVCERIELNVE